MKSAITSQQPLSEKNREVLSEKRDISNQADNPQNLLNKSIQLDDNNFEEYIQILEEHQKNCQKTGKYVEAEMAKNRIKELRAQDQVRRKKDLKSRQLNEKLEIEQAYLNEFNNFNEFWDQKMNEFNQQAKDLEDQMLQRHQNECDAFIEELEKSIPSKCKESSELLNLRRIEESLARQQNYVEAHQVQQQAVALEKDETEKWKKEREGKIFKQRQLLEKKQEGELFALRKRIEVGQEEQRKARSMELERLLQKYQNVKKGLENQHTNELQKYEKACQHPKGSMYRSTVNNSIKLNESVSSRMYTEKNK